MLHWTPAPEDSAGTETSSNNGALLPPSAKANQGSNWAPAAAENTPFGMRARRELLHCTAHLPAPARGWLKHRDNLRAWPKEKSEGTRKPQLQNLALQMCLCFQVFMSQPPELGVVKPKWHEAETPTKTWDPAPFWELSTIHLFKFKHLLKPSKMCDLGVQSNQCPKAKRPSSNLRFSLDEPQSSMCY